MTPVESLQDCLAAEHAALFGYGVIGGVLDDINRLQERAWTSYVVHRDRRDALVDLIGSLGQTPVAAEAAYTLPSPATTASQCATVAVTIEERCAEVYAATVATTVGANRELAAGALTDYAIQAVLWGSQPEPFPGVAEL